VKNTATYANEKDARRENIKVIKAEIFSEPEGKKVIETLLPKYLES
jgi:F0F1-type ATP synthase gamma subunit